MQGSITELPLPDDRFDFAVCLDVIEHIDDDLRALRELHRVVRPGGTLLVTVPAYQWLWSEHDVINHHKRRYTRKTLSAVAARGRLGDRLDDLLQRLPAAGRGRPPPALAPARTWSTSRSSDLQRTPERLNSLLEWPLRFEAWLIGRAGGSRPASRWWRSSASAA